MARMDNDKNCMQTDAGLSKISGSSPSDLEKLKEVGAKVKVKWTVDEIGDSGWRPGWYVATIQSYSDETDRATLVYSSEPGCTYEIDLSTYINQKKIQLVRAVI